MGEPILVLMCARMHARATHGRPVCRFEGDAAVDAHQLASFQETELSASRWRSIHPSACRVYAALLAQVPHGDRAFCVET
eukprot:9476044-Pyramimonas_sp.AAC.1